MAKAFLRRQKKRHDEWRGEEGGGGRESGTFAGGVVNSRKRRPERPLGVIERTRV